MRSLLNAHSPFIECSANVLPLAFLLTVAACNSDDSNRSGLTQAGAGGATLDAGSGVGGRAEMVTAAAAAGGSASAGAGQGGTPAAGSGMTAAAGQSGMPAAGGGSVPAIAGSGGASGVAGSSDPSDAMAGSSAAAGSDPPAGGSAGSAGSNAGSGGAGGPGNSKPKCKTDPDQVIVIGDSYLNWLTHTFPEDIVREAGETWRMYALGGCSLGSGGLCLIGDQLDQAIADDPDIIAVVMTGGGNDILIADEQMFPGGSACKDQKDSPMVKACQDIVATATAAGEKLMQKAAAAGVRDVIYLYYPHTPGGGFGGMNPTYLLDYALPMARALCDGAEQRTQGKLRCHFIDLVPIFEGHPDWFADDGIHENELGSAAMAKEVVRVAKEKCIAQPPSSGCCEP